MYWLWKINNNDYEWGVINKIIITPYFLMDFPTGMKSQSEIILYIAKQFKGSPDQSHFIFEINVGKSRIRHLERLWT